MITRGIKINTLSRQLAVINKYSIDGLVNNGLDGNKRWLLDKTKIFEKNHSIKFSRYACRDILKFTVSRSRDNIIPFNIIEDNKVRSFKEIMKEGY